MGRDTADWARRRRLAQVKNALLEVTAGVNLLRHAELHPDTADRIALDTKRAAQFLARLAREPR